MKKIIAASVLAVIIFFIVCDVNAKNRGSSDADAFRFEPGAMSRSTEAIVKICGLKCEAEQSVAACVVNVESNINPYDVVYDYGAAYNSYVDACDWSLVFDADYYISEFPLLAWQYNRDRALLLKHFQTVGIHEGRQGSKNFNVGAYRHNCKSEIREAFGDSYEGYYFYYMLNHAAEKFVNTEPNKNFKTMYKLVSTALQTSEFEGVNAYRAETGAADLRLDSELTAFANKRAYINAHDGYRAHDWLDMNSGFVWSIIDPNTSSISENTCEHQGRKAFNEAHFACYRSSQSHYEAMIDPKFDILGCSNNYRFKDFTCQFDCFIDFRS